MRLSLIFLFSFFLTVSIPKTVSEVNGGYFPEICQLCFLCAIGSSNLSRAEVKLLHSRMAKLETRMDEMESNISTQLAFITKSLLQITTSHNNSVYLNKPSNSSRPLHQSIYDYANPNLPGVNQQGAGTPVLFANSQTTGSKILQETKLTEPTSLTDLPEKVNQTHSTYC